MHIGYKVYFYEKGIGEVRFGTLARFRHDQKDEAVEMVNRLKSGELANYDTVRFGWLDPEKYEFDYMETFW